MQRTCVCEERNLYLIHKIKSVFVIIGITLTCTNLRVFIKVMADPGDQLAYGFYKYWQIILVFVKAIEFFFRSGQHHLNVFKMMTMMIQSLFSIPAPYGRYLYRTIVLQLNNVMPLYLHFRVVCLSTGNRCNILDVIRRWFYF